MIETDLGCVTAYADAVAQGYTGTREKFGQVLANFADSATQVAADRTAVEAAKASVEEMQLDVAQKQETATSNMNTAVEAAEKAKQSASDAEASKQAAAQSEQNINNTVTAFDNHVEEKIAGFDSRVFEAVEQSKEEINTTKQQAIDTITNQQDASVNIVKTEGEKIITKVGNDAKTVADDRATVEEATQTVLNNAQEVAQNTQTVASNTENAAASAEGAKTSADNAAQSAKSVEDASKQIEQNKKDVASLKEDLLSKITKFYASNQGETHITDSDNGKIQDMMIYGKLSQDGTPSPENPVEIKSVVNPTVKVINEDGLKVQSVTLNNITLNAIPVNSGGNVTIGEQQYVSDYVDVEKGKLYRKVKRLNLKDVKDVNASHGLHSNGNGYLAFSVDDASKKHRPISNRYKSSVWTDKSGYAYIPSNNSIIFVDDRFTDRQTAIKLVQDTYVIYVLVSQTEEELSLEQIKSLKSLSTYYPTTNISVNSEQLDGYTVFNYPISMTNGWNYVKQQLNDNRDYIYDVDLQSAEAYVNSEYTVALTELEV
jgi:chemotaxis protein histidine kinase CheA